ncbi:MAG: DUF2721 domain-containing protein [Candidatus Bathyarchaeia archaeon]
MEISELMNTLQATLGSVVMISSSALICLIIQTRYGRVVDRIRYLLSERRNLQQEVVKEQATAADTDFVMSRLSNIDAQIELLLRRGLKLKRALFLAFSAVFSFIFTSFLTLIGTATGAGIIIPLVALTFFLGMFFLLLGAVTTVNEIANSYDAVTKEVRFARSEISRSYPSQRVRCEAQD